MILLLHGTYSILEEHEHSEQLSSKAHILVVEGGEEASSDFSVVSLLSHRRP